MLFGFASLPHQTPASLSSHFSRAWSFVLKPNTLAFPESARSLQHLPVDLNLLGCGSLHLLTPSLETYGTVGHRGRTVHPRQIDQLFGFWGVSEPRESHLKQENSIKARTGVDLISLMIRILEVGARDGADTVLCSIGVSGWASQIPLHG